MAVRSSTLALRAALALLVALVGLAAARTFAAPPANSPPTITATWLPGVLGTAGAPLAARTLVPPWTPVFFSLAIADADGDPVSLRVVAAPNDFVLDPVTAATSPAKRLVSWYPVQDHGGLQLVVLEAWDAAHASQRVRLQLSFEVVDLWSPQGTSYGPIAAPLDGDPQLELLGACSDRSSRTNDFAAYGRLDLGGASAAATQSALVETGLPPSAGAVDFEQLDDVTGDGVADLVTVDLGSRVEVWEGGPPQSVQRMRATLRSTDPSTNILNRRVRFADVTGDGIDDLVVPFESADVNGLRAAGELAIFEGGAKLRGTPPAWSLLRAPTPARDDFFGGTPMPLVGDVTGDGRPDVVVPVPAADVAGAADAGCLYLFDGATLAGAPVPLATLVVPGAPAGRALGDVFPSLGTFLVDVTGDGVLDVVSAARKTTTFGGAVDVWKGGATLSGTASPSATLAPSVGVNARFFPEGSAGWHGGQHLAFADLDADGIRDVIVGAPLATVGGIAFAGGVFVWRGGAGLAGSVAETALLERASLHASDDVGGYRPWGMQLADVTGDGVVDVVCGNPLVDTTASSGKYEGSIEVWHGRVGLAGVVGSSASLELPTAHGDYRLTDDWEGEDVAGLILDDVTGDGVLDVIGAGPLAEQWTWPPPPFQGVVCVWQGGASLASSGTTAPRATLTVPYDANYPYFGMRNWESGAAILRPDWNGDGVRDLVISQLDWGYYGDHFGSHVHVFEGGAALAGTPAPFAQLDPAGYGHYGDDAGDGLLFADVTGDGETDLVVAASRFLAPPLGGMWVASPRRGIAVFAGGPTASGVVAPLAFLQGTVPTGGGFQTEFNGSICADLDADGFTDVVVADPYMSATATLSGGFHCFRGPIARSTADLVLTVPQLGARAFLGR